MSTAISCNAGVPDQRYRSKSGHKQQEPCCSIFDLEIELPREGSAIASDVFFYWTENVTFAFAVDVPLVPVTVMV